MDRADAAESEPCVPAEPIRIVHLDRGDEPGEGAQQKPPDRAAQKYECDRRTRAIRLGALRKLAVNHRCGGPLFEIHRTLKRRERLELCRGIFGMTHLMRREYYFRTTGIGAEDSVAHRPDEHTQSDDGNQKSRQ